eukprot:14549550-Heterocapsa_arctica.AAC.1
MVVVAQLALSWRLADAGLSDTTYFWDQGNVVFSTPRASLNETIRHNVPARDAELLEQHVNEVSRTVKDETGSLATAPMTGVPPGGTFASELFLERLHPALDHWLEETSGEAVAAQLCWQNPSNVVSQDVTLSTFADDMARNMIGENAHIQKRRIAA